MFPTALGDAWRTVLIKEQPGQLVYALYANNDALRPSGHLFTTGDLFANGTAQLPANAWSHLAMTWDGTTQRLYVNGSAGGVTRRRRHAREQRGCAALRRQRRVVGVVRREARRDPHLRPRAHPGRAAGGHDEAGNRFRSCGGPARRASPHGSQRAHAIPCPRPPHGRPEGAAPRSSEAPACQAKCAGHPSSQPRCAPDLRGTDPHREIGLAERRGTGDPRRRSLAL